MQAIKTLKHLYLSLLLPEETRCALCNSERALVEKSGFCGPCWEALPHHDPLVQTQNGLGVVSPLYYRGEAERLVKDLKFHNKQYMAQAMGRLMGEACRSVGWQADALVPVPLHTTRQRERGFNQAQLLAEHMRPIFPAPVEAGWLKRIRPTEQQAMLQGPQRRANVYGAFWASEQARGKTVCLVDDVITTGATLRECADMLELQGARVWICACCIA